MQLKRFILLFLILSTSGVPFFVFSQTEQDLLNSPEVKQINDTISSRKDQLKKIQDQQEAYRQEIQKKQREKATLNNQLSILDNRLASAQLNIERTQIQSEEIRLEIMRINLEMENKNKQMEKNREKIGMALRLLDQQSAKNDLEVILLNDYLSNYLDQLRYLEDINSEIEKNQKELAINRQQLENDKTDLAGKQQELDKVKKDLVEQQGILADQKASKDVLLKETMSSESKFQKLLAKAKEEQRRASNDIYNLEKTISAKLEKIRAARLANQQKAPESTGVLMWPTSRSTITAYFHDPSYPYRYIFEHPAIDIKAGQGTPIKASDSGYIARAKGGYDNSYAYIMIVHDNGLATVYGHVSKIYVKEDEFVSKGQVIGLSGGAPGSIGSGGLTTGSHLHFEVRLNGIPVDPLGYLP